MQSNSAAVQMISLIPTAGYGNYENEDVHEEADTGDQIAGQVFTDTLTMRNTFVPEVGKWPTRDHDGNELCDEPGDVEAAGED